MIKSVNKKIPIIIVAFFVALAFALSSGVQFSVTRADTPAEQAESIYTAVKGFYSDLRTANIEIDTDDKDLESVKLIIDGKIGKGEDVSALLNGDVSLSGIKKMAEEAVNLYNVHGNDAKNYLKKFSVSNYEYCNYDYSVAKEYLDKFGSEPDAKDYSAKKQEIKDTYDVYFGDIKADETNSFVAEYKDYVVKSLGVTTEADAEAIKNQAINSLDTCTKDEEANKIVSDFNAKFNGVYKFIGYIDEKVISEGYDKLHADKTSSAEEKKNEALRLAGICEDAMADVKKYYDSDANVKSHIQTVYVNICKDGLEAIKDGYASNYGRSADDKIIENRNLARELIDGVSGTELKIVKPYSYRKDSSAGSGLVFKATTTVNVNTGKDVVNAFYDSYSVKDALQSNGKKSEVPDPKTSTVTYKGTDFTLTITSVDKNGNEIKDFDSYATIEVREGTTPTIERNINTILDRKDLAEKISSEVGSKSEIENLVAELKGKKIQYFYTITVYEGGIVRDSFSANYRVEIQYKEDVLKDHKYNVINYYHTEITGAVAENKINTEGKNIMFYTGNFSQFALLADVEWVDLAKWVIIGLVAFILLIWLIILVIYLVKNKKFTVIFDANGGRPTTHVRLKHKEKFSYPKNPVRRGHVFMGWYTTRKCETRFASTELINRKRVTVYAKWITEEEYKALVAESEEEKVPTVAEVKKVEEYKAEEPVKEEVKVVEEKAEPIVVAPVIIEEPVEEGKEEVVEEPVEEAKEEVVEELVEKVKEEVVEEPVEEVIEEVVEEAKPTIDVITAFDDLKSEIYSYEKANDLGYAFEKSKAVSSIKVVNDAIELEVALDKEGLIKKGYNVEDGERFPSKMVIATEEDYKVAEELVEEVMYDNGLKKSEKAVLTSATEVTREEGFVREIEYDKVAETAEELFKVLRVFAKSYVKADGDKGEDKALIKMFTVYGRVSLYLNYFEDGMNECDEAMKALGYRSFVVVRNAEEGLNAEEYIKAMMKENGLVRYPVDSYIAEESTDKGFSYTLKY